MTTINGVAIHAGFFKARREPEHRVGAGPSSRRVKPTAVYKPSAPRAKYAMPVIAIVAAIGTFAAGAAIATAAGATIGAMIVGGAMMVGGALTIIGAATDRPNLVKWGGILSLAGGLGAGVLGAMDALSTTAAETAATTGTDVATSAGDADQALANAQVGATPPPPAPVVPPPGTPAPSTVDGLLSSNAPVPPGTPSAPAPGLLSSDAAAATPPAATPPAATPLAPVQPDVPNTFAPNGPRVLEPGAFDANASQDVFDSYGKPLYQPPPEGYFDKFGRWVKENPELAKAGFQATGMLASSLYPKPTDAAYINAMNTNARIARMKAGLEPGWWSK